MTRRRLAISSFVMLLVVVSACGTDPPPVPDNPTPDAAHELLVGESGQDFLDAVSTYAWADHGARAGGLVNWIALDATSPNAPTATRAGESASAVARFLSDRGPGLLNIESGLLGQDHKTVGSLNPDLVQAFATALIPFQGAMVCDPRDTEGFTALADPCEAAVLAARPVFEVVGTDSTAADAFANAAYTRMDDYLRAFAENDPASASNPLPSALSYVGRLLGLVTVGLAGSGVTPPTVDQVLVRARYTMVKAMLAKNPRLTFPPQYFHDGKLMSPNEVEPNLGVDMVDDYALTLANFLINNGNVEQMLTHNLRGQYELVAGGGK